MHLYPSATALAPNIFGYPKGQWENALAFLCKRFRDVPEATWRARFENGIVDQTGQGLYRPTAKCGAACAFTITVKLRMSRSFHFRTDLVSRRTSLVVDKTANFYL